MLNFAIIYNTEKYGPCVCTEEDSQGEHYGFTYTEEDAQERVQRLAEVGIVATYKRIDEKHWINNLDD